MRAHLSPGSIFSVHTAVASGAHATSRAVPAACTRQSTAAATPHRPHHHRPHRHRRAPGRLKVRLDGPELPRTPGAAGARHSPPPSVTAPRFNSSCCSLSLTPHRRLLLRRALSSQLACRLITSSKWPPRPSAVAPGVPRLLCPRLPLQPVRRPGAGLRLGDPRVCARQVRSSRDLAEI